LAPSPTGYLHLGHAKTFQIAWQRAKAANGRLLLRNDDLDQGRSRGIYVDAFLEDLAWLGLDWEGQVVHQSQRLERYREVLETLIKSGQAYPCVCSRRDIAAAISAPHQGEEEPAYPGTCRSLDPDQLLGSRRPYCWRLKLPAVPKTVEFVDLGCGPQCFEIGKDFGDFVIWRQDATPSYQLACVVDDYDLEITEVVRGEDLLMSTARQICIYQALNWLPPEFYHCPLVRDEAGQRLAKRHDALSIRECRHGGMTPEQFMNQNNA
jgi:glutamyl/glutaminyl-tRNA synthetase